ncbi:MAG: DegT/DnrJ/EryC1/StrS family aminotransferase [Verrucomicrobiota bacterium]
MNELALLGGSKTIEKVDPETFKWPVVTDDHRRAVLDVIDRGAMSGLDVTQEFEAAYAKDFGRDYALLFNNGTAAIQAGFWAVGVGNGDEVICPSITYWASVLQVYSLGATPVFADIDPETLCLDPADFERCITERTKAVVVVHYAGHPADMDAIMEIAKRHGIKVLEDCSHAHACHYKGRQVGTFGDVAGFSLMSGKSFAIGEAGMLTTDCQEIYEWAILFGQYARHGQIELEQVKKHAGLPCGGYKYRPHQCSSAFGLVQMKYYKQQFAEIDKAMTYFCDRIDQLPGIRAHRPKDEGSTKGGWYFPLAHYSGEELGGLSVQRFVEAVIAEGTLCNAGCNKPLHTHSVFTEMDIYNQGRPARIANLPEGMTVDQMQKPLAVSETVNNRIIGLPRFITFDKELIDRHVAAYGKVVENHAELLEGDKHVSEEGGYSATYRKRK